VPDSRLDAPLPLQPKKPLRAPALAPEWVALLAAWLGVIVLISAIVFIFLPGTRDPRAELEHRIPYSLADRFLPFPIYGVTVVLFLGVVVLWQMRKETRPLPDALVIQRFQAFVAIALALIAAAIVYVHVALHGPR
jgi:hypothetical protein